MATILFSPVWLALSIVKISTFLAKIYRVTTLYKLSNDNAHSRIRKWSREWAFLVIATRKMHRACTNAFDDRWSSTKRSLGDSSITIDLSAVFFIILYVTKKEEEPHACRQRFFFQQYQAVCLKTYTYDKFIFNFMQVFSSDKIWSEMVAKMATIEDESLRRLIFG